jgi:hypothetical protein
VTDYDRWLDEGARKGWIVGVCLMHDWLYTDDEAERLDTDGDPCAPRLLINPPAEPVADPNPNQPTLFGEA